MLLSTELDRWIIGKERLEGPGQKELRIIQSLTDGS